MMGEGLRTTVVATAVLSARFTSAAMLETETRLVMVRAAPGTTAMRTTALPPPEIIPKEQFTNPGDTLQEPLEAEAETTTTPGGSVSSRVVTGAGRGETLV